MNARMQAPPATPFVDASGQKARPPHIWKPLLITREMIEAEVERLASLPRPANGKRIGRIIHPSAGPGMGLSPGTEVSLQVLKPGEQTSFTRTNANQVELCLRGAGSLLGEKSLRLSRQSVWTVPPMRPYAHRNDGQDLWVRLTYSNAALLQQLGVIYEEDDVEIRATETESDGLSEHQRRTYAWQNAPDTPLTPEGARLRGYEYLTDIPVVDNPPLHWPWERVDPHLNKQVGDDLRTILLLYHPATERRAGTTHSFFATWARFAPGHPPFAGTRGHRHTSMAINYHMQGHGSSVVDGERVHWKAGDLLLSAPGWSEHAHYHGEEGCTVLTIQDHPMHIGLGSLLWQERMNAPILALGMESGQTGYTGPRKPGE